MKTPKKLTALVLMGALTVSSVAAVPASAKTFSDVPSNYWAYTVIDEVSNKTIMIGTGTNAFSPNTQLTKAEYSAILMNIAADKSNGQYGVPHFTDVPEDAWYASSVEWAVSHGLYTVLSNKFEPNEPISRELMADVTYRFIYDMYKDQIPTDTSSAGYADESSFSSQYTKSINALTHNGLLAGRGDNKFEPQGTLTRAEAAAMAYRLLPIVEDDSEPEDPNEPSEPEDPSEPSEPEEPGETEDPNDPSNWDLDGAPEWFLVGQPDNITDEQWEQLITYYADKERPLNVNYPSSIKDLPSEYQHNEELAKQYCGARMEDLYNTMLRSLAEEALSIETSLHGEEQEMVDLINAERNNNGTSTLKISKALCEAAQIRANECLEKFEHERLDGSDIVTVLDDVGLNSSFCALGENITKKTGSGPYSVEYAFSNFMNSAPHKKNILREGHKYVGVASASDGTQTVWVQLFSSMF